MEGAGSSRRSTLLHPILLAPLKHRPHSSTRVHIDRFDFTDAASALGTVMGSAGGSVGGRGGSQASSDPIAAATAQRMEVASNELVAALGRLTEAINRLTTAVGEQTTRLETAIERLGDRLD